MDFHRKWGNKSGLLGKIEAGVGRLGSERVKKGRVAWVLDIYHVTKISVEDSC